MIAQELQSTLNKDYLIDKAKLDQVKLSKPLKELLR